MNFVELQNSVLAARFNQGLRTEAKLWLNQRLGIVWAAADWPFKKSGLAAIPVDSDSGTVSIPSGLRRPLLVMAGDRDTEIQWLEPIKFDLLRDTTSSASSPSYYTFRNQQEMKVFPPGTDEIRIRYEKSLHHFNATGLLVEGVMEDDDDSPPYEEEFHYYLVQGAIATGLKRENDPTFQALEDDFNAGIFVMREELLPPNAPENRQFDRLAWG